MALGRLNLDTTYKSHDAHRFFTQRAKEDGIDGTDMKILRGDDVEGGDAFQRYIDPSCIAEWWRIGSPPLGIP